MGDAAMSRAIVRSNPHVVVTPRRLGDLGIARVPENWMGPQSVIERDMLTRCEGIRDAVERHVDNVAFATVKFDEETVCEHCGHAWTETSTTYNGGCCDKDEEAAP